MIRAVRTGGHICENKTTEDVEAEQGLLEEGEGMGRDVCVVPRQEVESLVRIAYFCQKRQDSDKLSSTCTHRSLSLSRPFFLTHTLHRKLSRSTIHH